LQCIATCCSVLQCVAVCCSVLQCVAVCCSVESCVSAPLLWLVYASSFSLPLHKGTNPFFWYECVCLWAATRGCKAKFVVAYLFLFRTNCGCGTVCASYVCDYPFQFKRSYSGSPDKTTLCSAQNVCVKLCV